MRIGEPDRRRADGEERTPLFSVVIPTYDRPAYLREAVASVLRQSVGDFELLVVDDASPSAPVLPEDPRVRLVVLPRNGGLSAARNAGLAAARGRFVTFLDDDDIWTPDRLELARRGLSRHPIAICWRAGLDGTGGTHERLEGHVHDRILDTFTPSVGQTAVLRDRCPPFDTRYAGSQDVEWWLRVTRSLTVATEPGLGYLVRRHAGVRHGNGTRARIRAGEMLLREHHDYFARHPRARAFRQLRIGLMAADLGEHDRARSALLASLAARPTLPAARHLLRVLPRPRQHGRERGEKLGQET